MRVPKVLNFKSFTDIAKEHELPVINIEGYTRTPAYYYDSLRHAFGFYFSTFITKNIQYEEYAFNPLNSGLLDEDNTVQAIISFQRFFELFLKDILHRVDERLNCELLHDSKVKNPIVLIQKMSEPGNHELFDKKSCSFKEASARLEALFKCSENQDFDTNVMVNKFRKEIENYDFLYTKQCRDTMEIVTWYRNRILHNGTYLPTMYMLDYLITQMVIPVVAEIIRVEKETLEGSDFYLETKTGINILKGFKEIRFDFNDQMLTVEADKIELFRKLLTIGHLKELGRANINMNLFMRSNRASYEYNYKDSFGRGLRFAKAEESGYPDAQEIKECPCCGNLSLVLYTITIESIFYKGVENIDWVKCYTCDYHIRYNVADPTLLGITNKPLFPVRDNE